jgi:uncharacterized protein (TIGR01777 family)
MKIAICGASGFVGKYLQSYFIEKVYDVVALKRDVMRDANKLNNAISDVDIVINLSGANIIQRWSKDYKKLLFKSRIETTRSLVDAMNANNREQTLVSTSAIGIYANDILCDEDDYSYGDSFLTKLCQAWEREAMQVRKRLVIFRFSVVMGHGGALQRMMLPFKLGLGGVIGKGTQAFSYIHIEDLARAYNHIIAHQELSGVFNLSASNTITNRIFTKILAKKLNRPAILPLPVFVLKLLFGEGSQVLSDGQNTFPKKLLNSKFVFKYPDINSVLDDLLLTDLTRFCKKERKVSFIICI